MTSIAVKEHTEITRPLRVLVPLIKTELELGNRAGLEHYRTAGEMLIEAKAQVADGEWTKWLKRNFTLSRKTARTYMRAAAESRGRQRPFLTLSEVIEPHRETHQPLWHAPVKLAIDKVNVERLTQERQNYEKEERLTRELALRLIDIGYKALLQKLHPDKGGSADAMTRLNRVRDLLKRAIR